MGQINLDTFNQNNPEAYNTNPQELYNLFKKGFRYRSGQNIFDFNCNTCDPHVPYNLFSATHPAGSNTYTYKGMGIVTGDIDLVWDTFIIAKGGKTIAQTQAEVAANLLQATLEQNAKDAAEEQRILAEQLQLKSTMLQSDTAVWMNPDFYNTALTETQKAIESYNSAIPVTQLPVGQTEKPVISQPLVTNLPNFLIWTTGILITIYLIFMRKK